MAGAVRLGSRPCLMYLQTSSHHNAKEREESIVLVVKTGIWLNALASGQPEWGGGKMKPGGSCQVAVACPVGADRAAPDRT